MPSSTYGHFQCKLRIRLRKNNELRICSYSRFFAGLACCVVLAASPRSTQLVEQLGSAQFDGRALGLPGIGPILSDVSSSWIRNPSNS